MNTAPRTQAFTLLELSIVLAIIGLLIGGIIAGQSMIKRAELASVASDLAKYKGAYLQFKEQYGGMPGDIVDATEYWGTDSDGCPDHTNRVPKKETCNGDGNNEITSGAESFRAWQQLADATFIEGSFTGVAGSGGAEQSVPSENAPPGRISNTVYHIRTLGAYSGDSNANFYDLPQSQVIFLGLKHASSWPRGAALSPDDQYSLDIKMDDGTPSEGDFRSMKSGAAPNCTTSDVSGSAAYNLSYASKACSIVYTIEY